MPTKRIFFVVVSIAALFAAFFIYIQIDKSATPESLKTVATIHSPAPWLTFENDFFSFQHPVDCRITDFLKNTKKESNDSLLAYVELCDQQVSQEVTAIIGPEGGTVMVRDGGYTIGKGFFSKPTPVKVIRQRRSSTGEPLALTPSDLIAIEFSNSAISKSVENVNATLLSKSPKTVTPLKQIGKIMVQENYIKNATPDFFEWIAKREELEEVSHQNLTFAGYPATQYFYREQSTDAQGMLIFIETNHKIFVFRDFNFGQPGDIVPDILKTFSIKNTVSSYAN